MTASPRILLIAAGAIGAAAISAACLSSAPPAEAKPTVAPAHVQGGDWFAQTGCTACHTVSVYGIVNLTSIAPDLSIAVEDVPKRFGRTLEEYLHAPTGTMEMVLSSRIPLTRDERDLAISKLKEAYQEHQLKNAARPAASH
jgi:hypothetical protein